MTSIGKTKRTSISLLERLKNCFYWLKLKVNGNNLSFAFDSNIEDIIIPIGEEFSYNVTHFLRHCVTLESNIKWIAKANDAIPFIDAKAHVNPSDIRYMHIYREIYILVHRLIDKLAETDGYFKHTKLRQTGSISSNCKVGLPHEADYVLELPDDKTFKNNAKFDVDMFYKMIRNLSTSTFN